MQPDEGRDEPALDSAIMAQLENERAPRADIEDTVVAGLQRRNLLRPAPRRGRRGAAPWVVGLIAAGVSFAAGLGIGERRGALAADGEARVAFAPAPVDAATINASLRSLPAGERVRTTAAAYIDALAAVRSDSREDREAAIATLRIASDQILRIDPASDMALAVRMAFAKSFAASPGMLSSSGEQTHLIRF